MDAPNHLAAPLPPDIADDDGVKRELLEAIRGMFVGCVLVGFDWRYLYANEAALRNARMTEAELLGRTMSAVHAAFDGTPLAAELRHCMEKRVGARLDTLAFYRDGSPAWFELTVQPVPTGLCILSVDITERKSVDAALRSREHSLREAQRVASLGSWELILGSGVRDWSEEMYRICERDPNLGPTTLEDLAATFPSDDWELLRAAVDAATDDGVPYTVDLRFAGRDGTPRSMIARGEAVRDAFGKIVALRGTIQDVTKRRLADESLSAARGEIEAIGQALGASDERFRQLAETIAEVFWLTDVAKGRMVYISPGYERIWGRPCDALYVDARDWLQAIHPEDRERVLHAALTKQGLGTYDEEYRIVRPDGEVRWIRDRAFPVRDATGKVYRVAGTAQDVTERRELEAQLRQTQKMESIGLLAGGIAHDFNNLLTVIGGNCEVLTEILPTDGEPAVLVSEVRDAGRRAAALTKQLLAFSRRELVESKVVDLNGIVADTEKMLRRILGEDIRLHLATTTEAAWVRIDPASWSQVLMNLAVNARDAMPRGGSLTIETDHVVIGTAAYVRGRPRLEPGPYVVLSVTDDGCGMTPDVAQRVFEPFFTTKRVGAGTGLGLSVVHGIVTRTGGHIDVTSRVGGGTTFLIHVPLTLPASETEAGRPGAAGAYAPYRPHGTEPPEAAETILLVEDEESIRRFAVRALEKQGYTVLQASDGIHGLEVLERHGRRIDLLITDVVMPRMDGRELAEAVRARYQDVPVLYMSGYMDDAVVRRGIQLAEVAFLPKPYDLRTLRKKVAEAIGRDGAKRDSNDAACSAKSLTEP